MSSLDEAPTTAPSGAARRLAHRLTTPTSLTLVLTLGLAAIAARLSVGTPESALLGTPAGWAGGVVVVLVAVTFLLTELGQALIEVRRQAYSFSLSGIPLVLGLLYVPPGLLIATRVVAALVAFLLQRSPATKLGFNTASYFLDVSLVIVLSHLLLPGTAALDLRTAALCYAALAVVDLVMSSTVLLVIRINAGALDRGTVLDVLLPATGFVVLNTAVGFICAVLLNGGLLGTALLTFFVATTAGVYRGYLVLRQRHQSLEQVQDFVLKGEGAGSVEDLARRLLTHVRVLMRAAGVELHLLDDGRGVHTRITVGEDDVVHVHAGAAVLDDLRWRCLTDDEPLIVRSSSTIDSHRRWLVNHQARDAVVVPLARSGVHGTLTAIDRMGDSTRFTDDDLALLKTLAGHLTVALHSTQLLQRLRHEATHDVLTGLPNRALLGEAMASSLTTATASMRPAVLLLDLDRFKEVNDALGHHVGDELLKVVATRLSRLPLPGATVARLGGDEFAVLLPPSAQPEVEALAAARMVATVLDEPVDLPDARMSTAASVGIAVARPGQDHTDLLRHADTAMYAAKSAAAGHVVYTPALDRGRAERLALLADLHRALGDDEIEVHFQPKLDLRTDEVTSVEALARWTHPVLGRLSPDVFVPLAESTGLVEQLTRVVLSIALRKCRHWLDDGIDVAVAVNLSARNLDNADLPDQVAAALAQHGVPPDKLILEITESSVMDDPERTVPTLRRLEALGVTLSLDDFGTGYSSLSYLQRLPVKEVKIDRSFVVGLASDRDSDTSAVLIRSIIALGKNLHLNVVAEGVESAAVMDELRALGCDTIQGYHIGQPAPADEVFPALHRRGLRTPTSRRETATAESMSPSRP